MYIWARTLCCAGKISRHQPNVYTSYIIDPFSVRQLFSFSLKHVLVPFPGRFICAFYLSPILRAMAKYFNQHNLEPISEEITPTDHEILRHGGTSSNIERLPSRIQRSKLSSPNYRQKIEDLAYEVSYLKAEVQWQKENKQIFLQFHQRMFELFRAMEDALTQTCMRMEESEKRYLDLWDIEEPSPAGGFI